MKPFAVISDIHANLEALKAVMVNIRRRKIETVFFLGDVVGYGPDPDACIDIVKNTCQIAVMGNHDGAVIDPAISEYFNEYARKAILWTTEKLSGESVEFIRSLKMIVHSKKDDICLVHSTPKEPEAWKYLYTLDDVEKNLHAFDEKICFLGHSHIPFIAERHPNGEIILHKKRTKIGNLERYVVNTGSVGQPRDGDPRGSYVVVTDETIEVVRVRYNIEKTQQKMVKADLPAPLIERLSLGR